MNPTISVIGSCRIHNPIIRLMKEGIVETNNHLINDFCHTPREALQKIRVANKKLDIPSPLHPLVFGRDFDSSQRADFSKSDIFFIEFSSIRRLCIDNIELQLNFLTEHIVKPYNIDDWLSELSRSARHKPHGKKVKRYCTQNVASETARMVNNIHMTFESDLIIKEMMDKISQYLKKPIVFVGHFNIEKEDGNLVSDRNRLNTCMKLHAKERGYHFFDPTHLISLYGKNNCLRDNNHWKTSFEIVAGHYLYQNYISVILKDSH